MKDKKSWLGLALAISMLGSTVACGINAGGGMQGTTQVTAADNPYNTTINSLVSTDALGRSFEEAFVTDSNNKVGLFYWIWHGEHTRAGIFNISELLENNPDALWGTGSEVRDISPVNAMHYWAEPLYGYYSSDDPWVIKKHLELFIMSGIDYLALDLTNLLSYDDTLEILASEIKNLQAQGWNPPTILPIFGANIHSRNNIYAFYQKFYKNTQYDSMWFRENGKPVLCIDYEDAGENPYENVFDYIQKYASLTDAQMSEFKAHFTFRNTLWPYQHDEKYDTVQDDDMSWIDWYYPQHISGNGFVNVSVAQHPAYAFSVSEHPEFSEIYYNVNRGRGWDYKTQTNSYRNVLSGLNLENQWKADVIPANPTKEGGTGYYFEFDGWYNGENKWDMANAIVAGDMSLVSKFTKVAYKYTLSMHMENETMTQEVAYGAGILLYAPEVAGKTFVRWYMLDEKNNVVDVPATMPAEDISIYAEMRLNTYTITFVGCDGVESITFTVETMSEVVFPEVPAKDGFTAVWDKSEEDLTLADLTVTAIYTEIPVEPDTSDSTSDVTSDTASDSTSDTTSDTTSDSTNDGSEDLAKPTPAKKVVAQ